MPNSSFANPNHIFVKNPFTAYEALRRDCRYLKLFKRKSKLITVEYRPNEMGFSGLGSKFDLEFFVTCEQGVETKTIINLFLIHNARIVSLNNYLNNETKDSVLYIHCNLECADFEPKDFALIVQKMKFVKGLEYRELKGRLFGSLFPLTFNGNRRAVALKSDALVRIGIHLAKSTGSAGTSALYDEGRSFITEIISDIKGTLSAVDQTEKKNEYFTSYNIGSYNVASESVEAYCVKCKEKREIENPQEIVLNNNKRAISGSCKACSTKVFNLGGKSQNKIRESLILENVQGFLLASGWGTFEVRTAPEGKSANITVLDPPTFEGDFAYGNQFLEGMGAGLLEALDETKGNKNVKMVLVGERYSPKRRMLNLYFTQETQTLSGPPLKENERSLKDTKTSKTTKEVTRTKRSAANESPSPAGQEKEKEEQQEQTSEIESAQAGTSQDDEQEVERILETLKEIQQQQQQTIVKPIELTT
jgi:hypothetical protein